MNQARAASAGIGGTASHGRAVGATLGVALLGSLFAAHAGQGEPDVTGLRLACIGGAIAELTGAALALAVIPGDFDEAEGRLNGRSPA
jgi:hypothetical protein